MIFCLQLKNIYSRWKQFLDEPTRPDHMQTNDFAAIVTPRRFGNIGAVVL